MIENPKLINIFNDKNNNTLLSTSLLLNKTHLIDYLVTTNKINWSLTNVYNMTYLHIASSTGNISVVKLALEKCPKLYNKVCIDKRTAIEHALISTDLPESTVIEIIKILVGIGTDINYRNSFGFRTIDSSIQHSSINVITELIKLGADINSDRIRNTILSPITNNDLIGFAAQLGRLDVLKLLLEYHVPLQLANVNLKICDNNITIKVPTALVLAILYKTEPVITYLLALEQVQNYLDDNVKKYLLKNCLKQYIDNEEILLQFTSKTKLDKISPINNKSSLESYKISILRYFPSFKHRPYLVINCVYCITYILHKIITYEIGNDIYNIFNKLNNLYEFIPPDSDCISTFLVGISTFIGHRNVADIKF